MKETITKKICDICGKEMNGEFGYLKSKFTARDYLGNGCVNGGVDFKDVCDSCGAKINDVIIDTIKEIRKKTVVVEHFEAYGQCRDSRRIANLEAENEELKRDKEDLIFIRDQRAKCMCEDKERLTQAKEIIRRLMDIINHDLKCFDTMAGVDVKQKAEQFLKETADIREASTYHGDWVVDEH